ncbi:hypothetical protein AOLI_G00320590 [Acnodon oligacanthus]
MALGPPLSAQALTPRAELQTSSASQASDWLLTALMYNEQRERLNMEAAGHTVTHHEVKIRTTTSRLCLRSRPNQGAPTLSVQNSHHSTALFKAPGPGLLSASRALRNRASITCGMFYCLAVPLYVGLYPPTLQLKRN